MRGDSERYNDNVHSVWWGYVFVEYYVLTTSKVIIRTSTDFLAGTLIDNFIVLP